MSDLKYEMEVMAVILFSLLFQLYAVMINDNPVFMFFNVVFPLSFIVAAMWKEGRLFDEGLCR